MPARTCSGCGVALPAPSGSGRPRSKCETCSPPRRRDTRRRAPHKLAEVEALPAPAAATGVYGATLTELESAGRAGTSAGQAALILADQLVNGSHSGAGYAALVKELRATLDAALEGAAVAADPLDELKRRRDQKIGSA